MALPMFVGRYYRIGNCISKTPRITGVKLEVKGQILKKMGFPRLKGYILNLLENFTGKKNKPGASKIYPMTN